MFYLFFECCGQFVDVLVYIVGFGSRHFVDSGFNGFWNFFIDFITKNTPHLADNDFFIGDGLAVVVHLDAVQAIQMAAVLLTRFFFGGGGQFLEDFAHNAGGAENAADIGK